MANNNRNADEQEQELDTRGDGYLSSDDEEPITAQKVLEILHNIWLNERLAPDLLNHQNEMLELMLGQILHMEENIKQLNKNDFRLITHQMELQRIRYIISSYLRCRLRKIETYTKYILNEEQQINIENKRLSPEEKRYASTYFENLKNHFHQLALQHMPYNLQQEENTQVVKPNLISHVFLKANKSIPSVIVGEDEEVDLEIGSQHIMPYKLAADLMVDGRVQLI